MPPRRNYKGIFCMVGRFTRERKLGQQEGKSECEKRHLRDQSRSHIELGMQTMPTNATQRSLPIWPFLLNLLHFDHLFLHRTDNAPLNGPHFLYSFSFFLYFLFFLSLFDLSFLFYLFFFSVSIVCLSYIYPRFVPYVFTFVFLSVSFSVLPSTSPREFICSLTI